MVRIAAAQAYGRFTPDEVCQHWEWTTRKIDFVRAHVDPTNFRLLVARRLYDMTHPMPPPLPQPPVTQEREVFFAKQGKGGDGKVFLFEETRMTHIKSRADLNALAASLGISNKEAVLSAETFQVLREGRTVYA